MYRVTIIHDEFEVEYLSDAELHGSSTVGDCRYAKVYQDASLAAADAEAYRKEHDIGREGRNRCFVSLATN